MNTGRVEQAFIRDPDGYYLEFCNCEKLETFLKNQMEKYDEKWNLYTAASVMKLSSKIKDIALENNNKPIEYERVSFYHPAILQ